MCFQVGDRLFSAFGQDTIDALFWTATEPKDRKRHHIGVLPHFLLTIIYVILHTLLVLLQATTLNVAVNASNKALLTIFMSNNVSFIWLLAMAVGLNTITTTISISAYLFFHSLWNWKEVFSRNSINLICFKWPVQTFGKDSTCSSSFSLWLFKQWKNMVFEKVI